MYTSMQHAKSGHSLLGTPIQSTAIQYNSFAIN